MPFRNRVDELVEQLHKAKEQEIAAIDRLRDYLKSHEIDVAHLKQLTREMVANCEHSASLWRQLHELAPATESDN